MEPRFVYERVPHTVKIDRTAAGRVLAQPVPRQHWPALLEVGGTGEGRIELQVLVETVGGQQHVGAAAPAAVRCAQFDDGRVQVQHTQLQSGRRLPGKLLHRHTVALLVRQRTEIFYRRGGPAWKDALNQTQPIDGGGAFLRHNLRFALNGLVRERTLIAHLDNNRQQQ
uniref:Uncharacterized protein n=1 Tax=Anopheles coluzzii TaxID=1518534 RepID=A0A8W7PFV1_ANOCL